MTPMAEPTTSGPIEGELVRLRALEAADVELLNPKFNEAEVLENLAAVPFPQPAENFEEFRRGSRSDPSQVNFAVQDRLTGEVIGVCGLEGLALHLSPELGLWLGKDHWDQGYGTDTVRTLCRHAFRAMGVRRVTLHVLTSNERAIRAYEKVGFMIEGTQREAIFTKGRWRDLHVMGLLAIEFVGTRRSLHAGARRRHPP